MIDTSTKAEFEVILEGEGISPEMIPLALLSEALRAIQRIAMTLPRFEDEPDEPVHRQANALSLLAVERGSARYRVQVPGEARARENFGSLGRLVGDPRSLTLAQETLLAPIKDLSEAAKRLGCTVSVLYPGDDMIAAKVGPTSYKEISDEMLIPGETSFMASVHRVGGRKLKCSLRVDFQRRLLYSDVAGSKLLRELGRNLYQRMVVSGEAKWLKHSMRMFSFKINKVKKLKATPILDFIEELREAGGRGWDLIEDPDAFLNEEEAKEEQ